ncbi:hypothetical protein HFRIS_003378 [Herbaspirillum frisingense GSF30]|uniref:Uncharacterized protein n=1 Tax=Herbaspirillum frisingense GSF30 TaxID=864073 RepID=A0AAI9N562_9BURK|nr:hypothetical protein HFRIS_003378 [Herbaspirillum frisingense GSF30]
MGYVSRVNELMPLACFLPAPSAAALCVGDMAKASCEDAVLRTLWMPSLLLLRHGRVMSASPLAVILACPDDSAVLPSCSAQ